MRMRLPNDDGYAVHDELSGCPRAHLYSLSKAGGPANPPPAIDTSRVLATPEPGGRGFRRAPAPERGGPPWRAVRPALERAAVGAGVGPALGGEPAIHLGSSVVIQIEQGVLVVLAPLEVAFSDHNFVARTHRLSEDFPRRGDDLRFSKRVNAFFDTTL
ncbi:MAG: hypothetical protein RIS39_186, partial [Actinomycetota bacterium]